MEHKIEHQGTEQLDFKNADLDTGQILEKGLIRLRVRTQEGKNWAYKSKTLGKNSGPKHKSQGQNLQG